MENSGGMVGFLATFAIPILVAVVGYYRDRKRLDFKQIFKPQPAQTNGSNGNGNGYGLILAKSAAIGQEAILSSVDKLEKLIEFRFREQDAKIERLRVDYEQYALKLTESANGYTNQRVTELRTAFDELRQSIVKQG